MSCIHYKFRSALEYDTITFDGLSISLADLKHSIITQKKFGKNTDFDLEVTNAQTKEEYKDEMTMIPKNSSVVVRRIPIGPKSKAQLAAERASPFSSGEQKTSAFQDYQVAKSQKLSKVADLANADASEEDKLKAMMKQSGEDWDPSQYVRGRRGYASGVPVPHNYVCYRCGKPGHFIRNCPTNGDNRFDVPKAKRTTGIPRTFLGTTEGTASPPSRLSPSLPEVDSKTKGKEKGTVNKKVPSELKCPTCNNLLTDAVLIPCCGTSYCDDCIRNYLLENEQTCPSCRSENVSPDSLVINKQLRQAVNSFKNARPASPYVPPLPKNTSAVTSELEIATKVVTDSASSDKTAQESKPANKVVKEVNETNSKTKESSPKPAEPLKPPISQPQPIRVHHREAPAQQGVGLKQGGASFDPRRRHGEFLPRGQPRVPEVRHGLPEPIIPHGVPPEHIPRVPTVRPGITGPSHPGPPMNIPGYMPSIRPTVPAAIPRIHPVPPLVAGPLPHHPAFGAPVFEPLRPSDVSRSLTPPMSEREFYKMQKKLKSRGKKKREHEHPSLTFTSRESRPRKQLKKEPRKEPKKDGSVFDFDDELSEYRKLQKSRQRLRSRSLTPSRSWSRSSSPSRSRSRSFTRSRSPSHSSPSPARSPTPEGWDESRSPSPASSRDQSTTVSAEEKKRKHKKRKKEQKSKERKKQKTSHGRDDESPKEQKDAPVVDKNEEKTLDKKKHKRREKEKDDSKETGENKDKGSNVGEQKDDKEMKDKEKRKIKEKDRKKGNDKEKEKKSKEKKKKKDKDKDESSSGKKRKSKKKHKKHKRHKKEKSKEGEVEGEEETSVVNVKDNETKGVSSEAGETKEKVSTDELETQYSDEDETQHSADSEEKESISEEEKMNEEQNDYEKMNDVMQRGGKEQERVSEQNKEEENMDDGKSTGVKEKNEGENKKPPHVLLRSNEEGNGKESDIDEENEPLTGTEEKKIGKKRS